MTGTDEANRERRSKAPAAAWVVLIAACVILFWINAVERSIEPPAPAIEAVHPPDAEFVLSGRFLIGWHLLAQRLPGEAVPADRDELLGDLQAMARDAADELRLIILIGELEGGEPAAEALAAYVQRHDLPEPLRDDAAALSRIYERDTATELDPAVRQALIDRHGWYGRLALSFNLDPADATRRAATAPAQRTLFVLSGMTVAGIGVGALALVLCIVAIILLARGKIRWHYRPRHGTARFTTPFLETAAIFLALLAGISLVALMFERAFVDQPLLALLFALLQLGLYLTVLPATILWPLVRGVGGRRWAHGLGLHRGRGVWREAGLGLVGYLAGLPIVALGLIGTMLLAGWFELDPSHPVQEELMQAEWAELLFVFAMTVIWAPVVEELIFRGAMYHHMRRALRVVGAAIVVGLVFAIIHPQGLAGVPVLLSIAFVFALLREWRGSIVGPMFAHAVHNFAATLIVVLLMW